VYCRHSLSASKLESVGGFDNRRHIK
jgi:hypothetical protein